jgi:thioredoxin-dependent peroxiredoxin
MINIGDKAPKFLMETHDGASISNELLAGKKTVLYFYPKDSTPGCTTEAKDFSAHKADFDKLGVKVVGVSRDSIKSHCTFADKENLKITLATDLDGSVCEAFGVWVEKSMYGKKYMGIERSTFIIDESGKIQNVWHKVSVTDHALEVLNSLR